MRALRFPTVLLVLLLTASLVIAASPAAASSPEAPDTQQATVTVTLADMGLEFGAITVWQASLYAGAVIGDETNGRFTAWVDSVDGVVTFNLPVDISAGQTAPWDVPDDTYVRVRATGAGVYPTFDFVSDPFTLASGDFAVHFVIDSMNEAMPAAENETAMVMVRLHDMGGAFGAPGPWEASLYGGAVPGNETGGRFTAWVPAQDGLVTFNLPADVSAGNQAPWGEEIYIRVRSVGANAYPTFDVVGRPFMLTDGLQITSSIMLSRVATETAAGVIVLLSDLGLEFGAINGWQASLYAGAEIGNETGGRFTAWVNVVDGVVTFDLPADISAGQSAPWGVPDDTYVRVRSGAGAYPTFDMVSDPFTLVNSDFLVQFDINGVNEAMPPAESQMAVVMAQLHDLGGAFGAPGPWEASLYGGAVPGNETGGRFTAWFPAQDGMVTFNLPNDVSAGNQAPWGEEIYIRVRSVGAGVYPTFDLVGRPFRLTSGLHMASSIVLSRQLVEPAFTIAASQSASTNPVVPGTYIAVDVSAVNTAASVADALLLAPIDPETMYVMGSASNGAMPLTAAEAAAKGWTDLAAGRAPEDVVAVGWMGSLMLGDRVTFGFQVRVIASSGEVQHDVALFDGATFLASGGSDVLSITDNSGYLVNRSRRFNVDRDTFINGAQPGAFYGSAQVMWTGFFGQMRPLVHTPLSDIPGDAYVDVAYLYLYIIEGRGFNTWAQSVINVQTHQVAGEWMPVAVNWWTPWTMPGGDYGPAIGANHIGSGKLNTWLRLDVTEGVTDFLRGASNQGFIITNSDTTGVRYALAAKEYFDASKGGYIRVYFRTAN